MDRAKLFERWDKIALKNKDSWLKDYISEIKKDNYLDVDFLDYQGFRIFLETEKDTIEKAIRDFKVKAGDGNINFNDAGWGLYLIATDRANDLATQLSEYGEA